MARKQVGMIDQDLLARVDERADMLGQTRRVYIERALLVALEGLARSAPDAAPVGQQAATSR